MRTTNHWVSTFSKELSPVLRLKKRTLLTTRRCARSDKSLARYSNDFKDKVSLG